MPPATWRDSGSDQDGSDPHGDECAKHLFAAVKSWVNRFDLASLVKPIPTVLRSITISHKVKLAPDQLAHVFHVGVGKGPLAVVATT